MIKSKLIHPQILETIASAGHGSVILIADGNYPFITLGNPEAERVYLNLAPGLLDVPSILNVLVNAIPIEKARAIVSPDGEPAVFADYRKILPDDIEVEKIQPQDFYSAAMDRNVALVIATAEPRTYSNILLTIGVIHPE